MKAVWHQFLCFMGVHDWGVEDLIDLDNGDTVSFAKCNRCDAYKMEKVYSEVKDVR